jgi:hypothetical protein
MGLADLWQHGRDGGLKFSANVANAVLESKSYIVFFFEGKKYCLLPRSTLVLESCHHVFQ